MTDLAFDPEDVKVDELAERLSSIDDTEAIHALQKTDTRTTAAAHYERRINELRLAQGDVSEEDLERGYRITKWAGHDNYECLNCPYKTLDRARIENHVHAHR